MIITVRNAVSESLLRIIALERAVKITCSESVFQRLSAYRELGSIKNMQCSVLDRVLDFLNLVSRAFRYDLVVESRDPVRAVIVALAPVCMYSKGPS